MSQPESTKVDRSYQRCVTLIPRCKRVRSLWFGKWIITLLVFLNANRNNPQAHGSTIVSLHPEVFRVSYFPQGMEINLLSSSSKDNTRVELAEVEMDSYGFMV